MPLTQSEQYDIDSLRQERWDNFLFAVNCVWLLASLCGLAGLIWLLL